MVNEIEALTPYEGASSNAVCLQKASIEGISWGSKRISVA